MITDLKQKYERARELAAQSLLPAADLDSARSAYGGAVAQNQADEAAVSQSAAALNQAEVDLGHTVIRAPIDGVVLARNVDVGQTVAASLQAPTLFVIANDLTRMQVSASVDEADIGRVRSEQTVSFRVDAHPDQAFAGRIEQVRLQPVVNQSVVTYNTIISVENRDLRLMPGMTATVSILIAKRENALRLPTAALRFRPPGFEPARSGATPAPGGGGDGGRPEPRRVRLGLSDGRFVEVLEGLGDGERVVTAVEQTGQSAVASPSPGVNNPFSPQRQERVR